MLLLCLRTLWPQDVAALGPVDVCQLQALSEAEAAHMVSTLVAQRGGPSSVNPELVLAAVNTVGTRPSELDALARYAPRLACKR